MQVPLQEMDEKALSSLRSPFLLPFLFSSSFPSHTSSCQRLKSKVQEKYTQGHGIMTVRFDEAVVLLQDQ